MERECVLEKIQELINENEPESKIDEETNLNSLSVSCCISVLSELVDFYEIYIPKDEIKKRELFKVSNLIDFILEKKSEQE